MRNRQLLTLLSVVVVIAVLVCVLTSPAFQHWNDMNRLRSKLRGMYCVRLVGTGGEGTTVLFASIHPEADMDAKFAAALSVMVQLGDVKDVRLPENPLSDQGLTGLRRLTNLQTLHVSHCDVTGECFEELVQLRNLRALWCAYCPVNDESLKYAGRITSLKELVLFHTDVTDEGLEHLRDLTNLQLLELGDSFVTAEGVARLQEALPECEIRFHPRLVQPKNSTELQVP